MIHRPTTATLIDHIYTNNPNPTCTSGVIITDVTDHFAIFDTVKCKSIHQKSEFIERRIFSESKITNFKLNLNQFDFTPILHETNCETAYNNFISIYTNSLERNFPKIKLKANRKYLKKEPWMTEGLLKSLRTKSNLFNKKLKEPSEFNIIYYKSYTNLYNRLRREMKKLYYRNILELNKHSMKNTWKTLKQALGKQSNKLNFPLSFTINDLEISDKKQIAQSFNKFFSSIGKQTSQNVPATNKSFSEYLKNPKINSIFIEPVDSQYILQIVNKFKPKTSFGHDDIPTKLVKESINEILDPITHIVNLSLSTGVVPIQLKKAKVIPIYKASNPQMLKNYRPISLLPAFSKILEKVMFNKIMSYLNSQNILYKHQYGFRPKHQTIHPIMHLLNQCAIANNSQPKQFTASVFCDLSKAFDVISRDILLQKLEHYGIRGIAKIWISNYLSDRTQYVQLESTKSEICVIDCGVPQGSILGPLLYLIYVNDISEATDGNLLSFADDTSLLISDHDIESLFNKTNIEINKLYSWFCANKLSLNANKTKFIILKSPHQKYESENLSISIDGTKLCQIGNNFDEKSTKFLGVHIDEHLTWKHHLNYINSKISRALFMMNQSKNVLSQDSLKTLYHAMIHPYLSYGILAWGNATNCDLNRTKILQKRAIRTVRKTSFNSHTEPLFKSLNILNLKDLYTYQSIIFMHSYITGKLPHSFTNLYRTNHGNQATIQTRQASNLHIDRCDSAFARKLPLYSFPKIWNDWSHAINTNISRSQAKKLVKGTLLDKYQNIVKCTNSRCTDCAT